MMQSISRAAPMQMNTARSSGSAGMAEDGSWSEAPDESSVEFGGELAMAGMLSGTAAVEQKSPQGTLAGKFQLNGSPKPPEAPTREAGKFERNAPQSPQLADDAGALIQRMAVGSNTAAEIAGLKPWSKDWVMEGGLNRHPDQKTLLGGETRGEAADAPTALANLARLMAASSETSEGSVKIPMEGQLPQIDGLEAEYAAASAAPEMAEAAPKQGAGRRKAMSGDDFLSIRQQASPVQPGGTPSGAGNFKVIPGGLHAPVAGQIQPGQPGQHGQQGQTGQGGNNDSLPGGKPKQAGPIPGDTLGLIHPELNAKGGVALQRSALPFAAAPGTMSLNGAVVPGTMSRDRLSSESVLGVAQGIRELKAGGGGEMRLRLKPDHLGEIHLRVSAGGKTGSEIGLQIQASDERAKKILEESMGSLKESLAGQSLTLSRVDVQVNTSSSSGSGFGSSGQDGRSDMFGQQLAQGDSRQSGNSGNGAQGQFAERMEGLRSSPTRSSSQAFSSSQAMASARGISSGSGRIDVMA